MEHVFIVRHGDFDAKTRNLTDLGKKQISKIALLIKNLLGAKSSVIVTSTAPRALESSEIISGITKTHDYVPVDFLWSHPDDAPSGGYYHDQNPSKVMQILQPLMYHDVVILVSHFEVVNQFPPYFMQELFGKKIPCPELKKGEAIHIDVLKKECKLLKDINISLEAKLAILHNCLTPSGIPDKIPQELASYTEAFDEFKQSVHGCTDCFAEVYIKALTKFRDILLAGI
jgi:phosphohistidine phosphatase SixA